MIDWLWMRVHIGSAGRLTPGRVQSIDAHGNVEWETMKWLQARGSYDGTMSCKPLLIDPPKITPHLLMLARRSAAWRHHCEQLMMIEGCAPSLVLDISGSPAKFLQGHNAFGSNDLRSLGAAVILRVCEALDLSITDDELQDIRRGNYRLLRVDVNESFSTGSRSMCLAWLAAAEKHAHLQGRGRGAMLQGETVVWGKKGKKASRHWSMKAYCKGQEMTSKDKGHRPSEALPCKAEILAWADDKLRIELQCNARYLNAKGLDMASKWESDTPTVLYWEHLNKLNLSGEVIMKPAQLEALPLAARQAYLLWSEGHDVRGMMPKSTFYKRRGELLPHGIDIAVKCPDASSNVVPLLRYIEAKPVGIPEWAIGTEIYFDPRKVG